MTAATLSILSYNLKDYGKSTVATRRHQHELLRSLRPDVVCLQEIWDDSPELAQLAPHLGVVADALGMNGMPVPAPRSHCHMAILWRPEYALLYQRNHTVPMWHGLGVVQLDVGAALPLRVAVTHMPPWDPERRLADARTVAALLDDPAHATVVAGDWNGIGADPGYDPEPDWERLRPGKIWRHVRWTDDPDQPPRADRRPAQLLHRSGLHDAAQYLGVPWQPTGGYTADDNVPRRIDAFWTTRCTALRRYRVIDTPPVGLLCDFSEPEGHPQLIDPRKLSDHLPIMLTLDPSAL